MKSEEIKNRFIKLTTPNTFAYSNQVKKWKEKLFNNFSFLIGKQHVQYFGDEKNKYWQYDKEQFNFIEYYYSRTIKCPITNGLFIMNRAIIEDHILFVFRPQDKVEEWDNLVRFIEYQDFNKLMTMGCYYSDDKIYTTKEAHDKINSMITEMTMENFIEWLAESFNCNPVNKIYI